jgi:hypothetical protein
MRGYITPSSMITIQIIRCSLKTALSLLVLPWRECGKQSRILPARWDCWIPPLPTWQKPGVRF